MPTNGVGRDEFSNYQRAWKVDLVGAWGGFWRQVWEVCKHASQYRMPLGNSCFYFDLNTCTHILYSPSSSLSSWIRFGQATLHSDCRTSSRTQRDRPPCASLSNKTRTKCRGSCCGCFALLAARLHDLKGQILKRLCSSCSKSTKIPGKNGTAHFQIHQRTQHRQLSASWET